MSGDDFAADAQQYAALEQEMSSDYYNEGADPIIDPVMDLMGGNLPETPLDQQQVDAGYRQQNERHAAALQQRQAPQYQEQQQQQERPVDLGFPSAEDDPIGHFQQRMAFLENAMGTYAVGHQHLQGQQQFWNTVLESEKKARQECGDEYDQAGMHMEKARQAELKQTFPDAVLRAQGYTDPAGVRREMLNRDRVAVAQRAIQMGMSPAQLYYDLAVSRGYQGTRGPTKSEARWLLNL